MADEDTTTRQRGPWLVLLAVLAFLGIKAVPSGQAPDAEGQYGAAPKQARESRPHVAAPGRDFWWPLIDFHTTGPEKPSAKDDEPWPGFPDMPGWDLEFLIATVPDPADSSSGHYFDPMVDAIQRAVERDDYVLDRFYYPWPDQKGRKAQTQDSREGDGTLKVRWEGSAHKGKGALLRLSTDTPKSSRREDYQRQPGVLLFRAPPRDEQSLRRLLLVFLVGETATAGIQMEALTASLDFLSKSRYYRECRRVRIVGPSFSGSADSLAKVIREWSARATLPTDILASAVEPLAAPSSGVVGLLAARLFHPTFDVVAGGANAVKRDKFIEACQQGVYYLTPVSYYSTVVPQWEVFDGLLQYLNLLDKEGQLKERVAFLCEANTAFGRQAPKRQRASPLDSNLVIFPFAMRISEVRAGYEQAGDRLKGEPAYLPTFGTKLRIPKEEREARDMEPSLYPGMTAVTNERMLAAMVTTIAHERFRYVAIVASDIRDRLFLGTLVHQQCPNVRLLFTSGDALLAHPAYNLHLKGALVGSSYPLYARNQSWSYPFAGNKRRLLFTTQMEQGYYNATLALVSPCKSCWMQEYGPPFQRSKEGDTLRPPVWISMIGQNSLQPLAAVYPHKDDVDNREGDKTVFLLEAVESSAGPSFTPQHTTLWTAPFIALSVFVVVVGYACWAVLPLWLGQKASAQTDPSQGTPAQAESRWKLISYFQPRKGRVRRAQRWYLLTVLAAVAVAYSYVGYVCLIPAWYVLVDADGRAVMDLPLWDWAMPFVVFLLFLALLVLMARVVWRGWRPLFGALRQRRKGIPRKWRFFAAVACLIVLSFPLGYLLPERLGHHLWWFTALGLGALPLLGVLVRHWRRRGVSAALQPLPNNEQSQANPPQEQAAPRGDARPEAGRPQEPAAPEVPSLVLKRIGSLSQLLGNLFPKMVLVVRCLAVLAMTGLLVLIGAGWQLLCNAFLTMVLAVRRRAVLAMTGLLVLILAYQVGLHPPPQAARSAYSQLLFFERATNPANGLSPVVPIVLLGLGFFWWAVCQLRRLYLLEEKHCVPSPFAGAEPARFQGATKGHWAVQRALEAPHRMNCSGVAFAFWLLLFFTFCRLANRFVPTVEGSWFDGLFLCALQVYTILLVAGVIQVLGLWKHVRKLLQEIARLPLERAYGRIPDRIKAAFGPYLSSPRPNREALAADCWRQRDLLVQKYDRLRSHLRINLGVTEAQTHDLDQELGRFRAAEGHDAPRPSRELDDRLRATSRGCVNVLAWLWDQPALDPAVRRWRLRAENFVALAVINYLSQFFVQLRNQFLFLTVGSLLLLAVVLSYPFQPQGLWLLLAAALIIGVIVVGLKIFIAMEKDEVISQIVGSTPNRVNFHWSFLSNVLLYIAPLALVLLAASTDLADLLNSWLGPLFQVLR
jgi:hypothetical protein